MDLLAALRLQIEWGADEALQAVPLDRGAAPRSAPAPAPRTPAPRTPAPPATAGRPAGVAPAGVAAPVPAGDAVARAQRAAAAAASPDELQAALAQFDPFGLSATATSLVFADGNPAAGLVLIGDAPGAEEDASGIAFDGRVGRLLDRVLASIGLDRQAALLTVLVPWRPPGGRAPSETEVGFCLPFLQRHLALLQPRRIVTLGTLPARALLGRREPLARLRGKWHDAALPGVDGALPLLATLHPAQLLAQPEQKPLAWSDWRLLRRTLDQDDKVVNTERRLND